MYLYFKDYATKLKEQINYRGPSGRNINLAFPTDFLSWDLSAVSFIPNVTVAAANSEQSRSKAEA